MEATESIEKVSKRGSKTDTRRCKDETIQIRHVVSNTGSGASNKKIRNLFWHKHKKEKNMDGTAEVKAVASYNPYDENKKNCKECKLDLVEINSKENEFGNGDGEG